MMLCNSKKDTTKNPFVIEDACLTPLCKNVQLHFVQYTNKIKTMALIMKASFQLPVCVA